MQLPLLASTFVTVFLAELGDKTQLAIVTISGTSNRSGAVFAGSASALVLASLLMEAALFRQESRGGHHRTDAPAAQPFWQRHTDQQRDRPLSTARVLV